MRIAGSIEATEVAGPIQCGGISLRGHRMATPWCLFTGRLPAEYVNGLRESGHRRSKSRDVHPRWGRWSGIETRDGLEVQSAVEERVPSPRIAGPVVSENSNEAITPVPTVYSIRV